MEISVDTGNKQMKTLNETFTGISVRCAAQYRKERGFHAIQWEVLYLDGGTRYLYA